MCMYFYLYYTCMCVCGQEFSSYKIHERFYTCTKFILALAVLIQVHYVLESKYSFTNSVFFMFTIKVHVHTCLVHECKYI